MIDVQPARDATAQFSQEFLLKILDNSYDAIFATDSQGVTIYANKACETYYGIPAPEMIGKDPWQFMDKTGCYPPLAPIILSSKSRQTLEQTTGTGAKVLVTTSPIYDAAGNIEFLVQNCRDIRQLEDTKRDLEQTKEMLNRMQREVVALRNQELGRNTMLVANSVQMKELLVLADRVADIDINVLILGETGTGKSALAKYIHKTGPRREGPFISINCAAIPEDLIESELFGYAAGAFSGASQKGKIGLVELADRGTLFLDEIAELPLRLQGKVLEVAQSHRYYPVGGCQVKEVDCRIIAATNRDIKKMAKQGDFREDLYYRLSVMEMEIPPLRERPEDMWAFIYYFLNQFNRNIKRTIRFPLPVGRFFMNMPGRETFGNWKI
ncbi:MAG TPA: sigma 54-interacting transcriptional regulator [Patescibacteria group bacterium]|nr:sigma 54-interacting transcriptional regulator [Patescibacteria group bacterium]